MGTFHKLLLVFGMSMVPVLELRAAVPYGVAMDLDLPLVLIVSIIGNLLPVPFIIFFIRGILNWMKRRSAFLSILAKKIEKKAEKKKDLIMKYELLGLILIVAIPLPGTGAWTGALVASMFDIRVKIAFPAIAIGVIIAGLIMSFVTYGVGMII